MLIFANIPGWNTRDDLIAWQVSQAGPAEERVKPPLVGINVTHVDQVGLIETGVTAVTTSSGRCTFTFLPPENLIAFFADCYNKGNQRQATRQALTHGLG